MITVKFKRLNIQPSEKILDIGCGSGRHVGEASRLNGVFVVGADRNHDDLVSTRNRLNFIKNCGEHGGGEDSLTSADITALPFKNESFHHAICSEVMEHIPDHAQAARELVRVLKPGGNLVVSVPRFLPERICWALSKEYYSANGGHVRIYKKNQIMSMFTDQGLQPNGSHHYAHSIHTPFWWLKCLVGAAKTDSKAVNLYHRLLTWDIMGKPKVTRTLDKLMNPVMGKSLVLYFKKQ
jgi:2-polyprenyl-3-methyl-5-hydroxy-6-metoxy-1,4-benzoquinol methylase